MSSRNTTHRAGLALLAISGVACSLYPATAAILPTTTPPAPEKQRAMEPPRHHLPGFTVPGSQIGLPTSARAGSIIDGIAPARSRVEAAGQVVQVGEDRRFQLQIPQDARGALRVRIQRADGRVLVLRVEIVDR